MWECQILGLAWLDSFSGIQRVSILLAAANVYSHWQPKGIPFSSASLPHVSPAMWCWPLWVLGFTSPLSFWLEFLKLWGTLSILFGGEIWMWLFLFFIFSLEVVRTSHLLHLASWMSALFAIFFSPVLATGHFLRAAVLNGTPGLLSWDASGK